MEEEQLVENYRKFKVVIEKCDFKHGNYEVKIWENEGKVVLLHFSDYKYHYIQGHSYFLQI